MQDWRGTEIGVGDTIVYAVSSGSLLTINEAVVTGFGEVEAQKAWRDEPTKTLLVEWKRNSHGRDYGEKKKRSITEMSRVTVIEKVKVPDSIYGPHTEERHPEWRACKS